MTKRKRRRPSKAESPNKVVLKKKDRPRKIVESSPPVEESLLREANEQPRVDTSAEVAASEPEPVPEIGESQQASAEESAESPLFVREDGSDASLPATREGAVVALSDPPSSWARGAYEQITSSRPDTSEAPLRAGSALASSSSQLRTKILQSSGKKRPSESTAAGPTGSKEAQQQLTQDSSAKSLNQCVPDSQSQQDISGTDQSSQAVADLPQWVDRQDEASHESREPERADQSPESGLKDHQSDQPIVHTSHQQQAEVGASQDPKASPEAEREDEPSTRSREELAEDVESNPQEAATVERQPVTSARLVTEDVESNPQEAATFERHPATSTQLSQAVPTARSGHRQPSPPISAPGQIPRPSEEVQPKPIVISSTADHSDQSGRLISSIQSRSPPRTADFEPPPAGQRPPHSLVNGLDAHKILDHAVSPTSPTNGLGSSSFPFQTQIPTTVPTDESEGLNYSPGAKALFQAPIQPSSRAQSVRSRSSSPFPSIPSRSLGTHGESAPTPFALSPTESPEETMDSSSKRERFSFAAELKAKRDQRRASSGRPFTPTPNPSQASTAQPASALPPEIRNEVAASQAASQAVRLGSPLQLFEGTRSPSMVPAVEPEPIITKEDMNTSERYETLLPQAQGQSESAPIQNGTVTGREVSKPPRDPNEDPEVANVFAVPVAPSALQRDQYRENIYYKMALLSRFREERQPSAELLAEANEFLDRLRDIAMHPDLINPETLSQTTEAERQARWDAKCSAKFQFLQEILGDLQSRHKSTHVAVVASAKRLPGMVENFLNGLHVPNRRVANTVTGQDSDFQTITRGVKVSVIDLDAGLTPKAVVPADLVISLDASPDVKNPVLQALRKHNDSWSMLLNLVLPRTVEHMELCLQNDLSKSVRTRMLMKATRELSYESGRLENRQAPVKEAAALIVDYLDDSNASIWPLAGLSQLEEMDSQTETDIEPQASYGTDTPNAMKRPLQAMEVDLDDDPTKRPRQFSPPVTPATINPHDIELTHVSDSLEKAAPSGTDMAGSQVHSNTGASEQQLRGRLQGVQDRLDEHVKALEDLQYRHEDQRKKLVEVTRERDAAMNAAAVAVNRMTGAEANNKSLRAERTQLKEALAEAKKSLLEHSVPERIEFERLRLLMEQATIDKDKAEKRAETTQKELDWTRSMYQDHSSKAIELANQNREYENRLTVALNKAQGEAARAREISVQGHNKALEQDNVRLRVMLENRDAALRFKDEEITRLKDSGRGRMGTRQTSQPPRSPRLGSPLKGRGSRAASPAVGDVGVGAKSTKSMLHPLRQIG